MGSFDDDDSLLELLIELQALDYVPRTGYLLRGVSSPESVSEHSWHLALLVWALGPEIAGLDGPRAVELALLHDVAEVRLGDIPSPASRYLPPDAKRTAELAAGRDLLQPLGERAAGLLREYVSGSTLEARFVKACDTLQTLLKVTAYERRGAAGLAEFWQGLPAELEREFPPVGRLLERLRRLQDDTDGA